MTITRAAAFSTGTTVQFIAGSVQDLAGNVNTAGSGTITSDTTKPTIVGNPTVVQAVGTTAVYSLDNKLLLTRKVAGSSGNDYDVIWVVGGVTTATTETCTAAGENITLIFTTSNASDAAGGQNTTSTAATMKATISASATCSALVTASIVGAGGSFTTAISATAQTDNSAAAAFSGGSHTMTVVTTFSETIKAVTGAPAGSISYDGGADNVALVANTATKTTITGAIVTSVHSVILDGDVFVPGTTTIDYGATIVDVAGNTLTAVADKVALVG